MSKRQSQEGAHRSERDDRTIQAFQRHFGDSLPAATLGEISALGGSMGRQVGGLLDQLQRLGSGDMGAMEREFRESDRELQAVLAGHLDLSKMGEKVLEIGIKLEGRAKTPELLGLSPEDVVGYRRAALRCYNAYLAKVKGLHGISAFFTSWSSIKDWPDLNLYVSQVMEFLENGLMIDGAHGLRKGEVFDAYYFFAINHGSQARMLEFLNQYATFILNMDQYASRGWAHLNKNLNGGDHLRRTLMETYIDAHRLKRRLEMDKNPKDQRLLADMGHDYLWAKVCFDGDFTGAKGACAQCPSDERDQYGDEIPGVLEDCTKLIPRFEALGVSLQEEICDQVARDSFQQAENPVFHELNTGWEEAKERKDFRGCCEVLGRLKANEAIGWFTYYNQIFEYLEEFVGIKSEEPKETAKEAIEALRNTEKEGMVRIPHEFRNICVARLCEIYFRENRYEETVNVYREYRAEGFITNRGMTFYAAKAMFKLAEGDAALYEEAAMAIKNEDEDVQLQDLGLMKDLWRGGLLESLRVSPEKTVAAFSAKAIMQILWETLREEPNNITVATLAVVVAETDDAMAKALPKHMKRLFEIMAATGEESEMAYEAGEKGTAKLFAQGRFKEIVKVVPLCPFYEKRAGLFCPYCRAYLTPVMRQELDGEKYGELKSQYSRLGEKHADLDREMEAARISLKISSYRDIGDKEYLAGAYKEMQKGEILSDGVRLALLSTSLKGDKDLYEQLLGELEEPKTATLTLVEHDVSSNVLREYFGTTKISFREEDGKFVARCVLKKEDQTKYRRDYAEFTLARDGKSFNLAEPKPEGDPAIVALLETALVEEIYTICSGDNENLTMGSVKKAENSKELDQLRAEFTRQLERIARLEGVATARGTSGVEAKNRFIVERIEEECSANCGEFSSANAAGVIAIYISMIKKSRDLERPKNYQFIGPAADIYAHPNFVEMRIFGNESSERELAKLGLTGKVPAKFQATEERKNAIAGYYQLIFDFDDIGEVPISVFLDQNGIATIPGISPGTELYNYLWFITLEGLVRGVVPELRPYRHAFAPNNGDLESNFRRMSYPIPKAPVDLAAYRKRSACAALILGNAKSDDEESLSPIDKRAALFREMERMFGRIALCEHEDLASSPLYCAVRESDGMEYKNAFGIVMCHEGRNYLKVAMLREITGMEIPMTDEVCGEQVADFEKIDPNVLQMLTTKILRMGVIEDGRFYELPIEHTVAKYPLGTDEEGKLYYLIPTPKPKNGMTDLIEISGKFYRRRYLPEGSQKYEIAGRVMVAKPKKMSPKLEAAANKATLEIPKPREGRYAVLYNPNAPAGKNPIVGYTFLAGTLSPSGNPVTLQSQRILDKLRKMNLNPEDLRETVLTLRNFPGYRRGLFVPLHFYLTGDRRLFKERNLQKLREEMRKLLQDSDVFNLFDQALKVEEPVEEATALENGSTEIENPADAPAVSAQEATAPEATPPEATAPEATPPEATPPEATPPEAPTVVEPATTAAPRRPRRKKRDEALMLEEDEASDDRDQEIIFGNCYTIVESRDRKKDFGGLYGENLFPIDAVPENHQFGDVIQTMFSTKRRSNGRIIVLVGGMAGRPAIVDKAVLKRASYNNPD